MGVGSKYVNWSHLNKWILSTQVKFLGIVKSEKRMLDATTWDKVVREQHGATGCNSYGISKAHSGDQTIAQPWGELCTSQDSAEPFRKVRRNAACFFCSCHSSRKKKTLIYFTNKCIAVRKSVCKKNLLSLFLSQTTLDFVCCWSKQTEYPHLTADLSPKALLGPSNIVVATFSGFLIEVNKLQQLLVLKNIQEF